MANNQNLAHKKRCCVPNTSPRSSQEREQRSAHLLRKFRLFCAAMIFFCVLMYIPVYFNANSHFNRVCVHGWPIDTSRDPKIYVQPNNVTTIHEPNFVCRGPKSPKLLLLIIVCSATENYERRKAIRETWGDYENYKKSLKIFNAVTEKYKNYNYTYDLYPQEIDRGVANVAVNEDYTHTEKTHPKLDKSSFYQLLPALGLKFIIFNSSKIDKNVIKDLDFDILPDMNTVIDQANEQTFTNYLIYYDYDYLSNVTKISPESTDVEENPLNLSKVPNLLKQSKDFNKVKHNTVEESNDMDREFRLVFFLGKPNTENITMQKKLEEEISDYGDIIQDGFVDSYNNLTLKSIMMLKWITHKCHDSVRYILKTDDDTYMNLPNLLLNLHNRSKTWDEKSPGKQEYLLIGDLIVNAKPVQDLEDKWFSPRFMYTGRVYPRYLSGMAYAMSMPTVHALYEVALKTHLFHLEDVYITGLCALYTHPRIYPHHDPSFSLNHVHASSLCRAYAQATAHRATANVMRYFQQRLHVESEVDRCERIRLTHLRRKRLYGDGRTDGIRINYEMKTGGVSAQNGNVAMLWFSVVFLFLLI